ncbi:MAG: PAS domain S-box protein [Pseudomonadota bacterium]
MPVVTEQPEPRALRVAQGWVALAALLVLGLWALPGGSAAHHLRGYLPLHTMLEFGSAVVAVMVFWVIWHGRAAERGAGMRWLSACLFTAALFDVSHALSYPGMPEYVTPSTPEKAIWFWLAGRLFTALGLLGCALLAPARPLPRLQRWLVLVLMAAVALAVHWAVIGHLERLPRTYVDGSGLTGAKVAIEWLIIGLMALAAWRLHARSRAPGGVEQGATWLFAAAGIAALAEWCFTRYGAVTDLFNLLGHVLKLASYLLIYRAVFLASVRLPLQRLGEIADALDTAANPICVADAQGRLRWANPAFLQATGYAAHELQQLQLQELSVPVQHGTRNVELKGAVWRGRVHSLRKDGSLFVDDRTVTPMHNDYGMVTGYVSVGDDVTERMRMEEALREQAERLRALIEAAPDAIVVVGPRGMVELVNPQFDALLGYRPEEVLGRHVSMLVGAEAGRHGPRVLLRRLCGGRRRLPGAGRDLVVRRKDGSTVHVDVNVGKLRLRDGLRLVCFVRDVTERIRAAEALAERELRYRALMETAADGMWVADMQGRLLSVNDAYAKVSGYSRDELLCMRIADLQADETPQETARRIERIRLSGRETFETRHRAKDGRVWPAEITATYWPMGNGLMFVFARDITARQQALQALRASEQRFQLAMRGANDGLWDYDLATGRLYLSPGWKAMLGYADHELPSRRASFRRQLCDSDRRRVLARMFDLVREAGAERLELEFSMRHRAGREVHVLSRMFLARDEHGRPTRLVGTHQDLTERRREQQEREALQRQLMQAQKMDALGQLTGGIAHDFNNMLAGVMGCASLALDRHVPEPGGKLERYLREIVRVSERGRELVARMLAYSRMDSGMPARPRDLAPRVREIAQVLRPALPAGIELALDLQTDTPPAALSDAELHQVLMNLVINARDAIGEHGRVEVSLRGASGDGMPCASCQQPLQGAFVCLAVRDDGSGMAPAVLARVFEPFFTTKDVGRGTGLGLPMVQGIAHKAGGHIRVHSAPGRGTCIELLLPAGPPGDEEPLVPAVQPPAAQRQGVCIWVIDDEPAVSLYLGDLFEQHGYAVRAFEDPQQALQAYEAEPQAPDAVVTDQTMPRLSGDALARAMLQRRPALPVILCTGYNDRIDEPRALAMGIRAYFRKPFDAARLLQAVADFTAAGRDVRKA